MSLEKQGKRGRRGAGPAGLSVSDIAPLIDASIQGFDDELLRDYLRKDKTFKAEHIVKRINAGIDEIRGIWPDASGPELYIAFDMCQESLSDMIASIAQEAFRDKVARETQRKMNPGSVAEESTGPQPDAADESDDDDRDDTDFVYQGDMVTPVVRTKRRVGAKKMKQTIVLPCPRGIDSALWSTWSEARKVSYLQGEQHPNAYYYRHLPPGEQQVNGGWSEHERELFMARMRQMRGNSDTFGHDWGLFSLGIPGRVGYQCSNHYRMLLETGELTDSHYVRGEDGKLHHTSRIHDGKIVTKKRGKRQQSKFTIVEPLAAEEIESLELFRHSEREEVESMDNTSESTEEPRMMSRYERWALQNPLPDNVDCITGEIIKVPALAPSGYVLDYNTWIDSLTENPVDPFTRGPLTKRQLVILTTANFKEYESKIRYAGSTVNE